MEIFLNELGELRDKSLESNHHKYEQLQEDFRDFINQSRIKVSKTRNFLGNFPSEMLKSTNFLLKFAEDTFACVELLGVSVVASIVSSYFCEIRVLCGSWTLYV